MTQEGTLQPEVTPEVTALLDDVRTAVRNIKTAALDEFRETFRAQIAQDLIPNRAPVLPAIGATPQPRETSGIRLTPSEDQRYRTLPEEEKRWRKPATDHWMADWFRAMVLKDTPRMQRAQDKLDELSRADLLEGTTTAVSGLSQGTGGHLMPLPFSTLIVRARDKRAKLRPLCTKYTSDSLTLRVPVSTVATAAMAAEGAVAAQGEPTVTAILFSKKKMQANFEMSDEMMQDSAFNLVSFLAERAGSAFGALEDVQICTSNGTAPNITSALSSITETTEGTPATLNYADVVNLFYAMPEQYQAESVWLADSTVLSILSRIRASGGEPLFSMNIGPANIVGDTASTSLRGVVGQIFGRAVYNVPLAAGSLFIANMSFYGILDGGGIAVKQSDSALWAADSIALRFTTRFDGAVMLPAAFAKTIGLTTAGT